MPKMPRPLLNTLTVFVTALMTLTATPGLAHEFWIEPQEYQVQSGAPLVAELRNGQGFSGVSLAYFSKRFQRFDLVQDGKTVPVEGRMGDVPALQMTAPDEGLLVIVHQTAVKTLTYDKWEKFAAFAIHKGYVDIQALHQARGLPDEKFTETYTRFAKALVGVGDARGMDAPTGMESEFVALSNPYLDDPAQGLAVQLLYQGVSRPEAQIEIFERSPDGTVTITTLMTDAQGKAVIPTRAGHTYLLDAAVLRPAPEGGKAVWESLWAALTFAVPD
jgi:uncharacterized GH25 family protein